MGALCGVFVRKAAGRLAGGTPFSPRSLVIEGVVGVIGSFDQFDFDTTVGLQCGGQKQHIQVIVPGYGMQAH